MTESGEFASLAKWWTSLRAYLAAIWSNILAIVGFVVVGVVLYNLIEGQNPEQLGEWYGGLFDPIVGLGTFVVAVGVWIRTARTRWEGALKQALNVRLVVPKDEGEVVFLVAETLPLSDPADIRPMAQQVLKSWNRGYLDILSLNFTLTPGRPEKIDGEWVRLWACDLPLEVLPSDPCTKGCDPKGGRPHQWVINPLITTIGQSCRRKVVDEQPASAEGKSQT